MLTMWLGCMLQAQAADWKEQLRDELTGGQVVWQQQRSDAWVWAAAAVLIPANEATIWSAVLDYDSYVEFLPYITASERLSVVPQGDTLRIESCYTVTVRGISGQFSLEGIWSPAANTLSFNYTDAPGSIEDGGEGRWTLQVWGDQVLLEYELRLPLQWWIPSGIEQRSISESLPRLVDLMRARALTLQQQDAPLALLLEEAPLRGEEEASGGCSG